MKQTHIIPAAPWGALATQTIATINDAQFAQAGVWQLRHVRIDLPMGLAQAPQVAHRALRHWLNGQGLTYLLTGARRSDVAMFLEFSKFF